MQKQHDVTRRDFLKAAAVVAGASALPSVSAPAILATSNPNEVVNFGFIGTGSQGCILLKFLTTIPTGRCVATCDIYPVNLRKGIETIGNNPATYEDYRRLLESKDVEAVMIATPLHLHARMTIDALNAGKHVFVEKSMFFKEKEAERIRQAAAAHPKRVVQVGLQRRSSALYRTAMEMVAKGALGKVTFVRAHWHRNSNWRRPVADPKLERQINWRMYRQYSGGLMAELASHQIDVANWAIGAEPVAVVGTGGIDYWKDGRETCDNVQAIFEYPGGQKLLFSSILSNEHYGFEEQIMGDEGTLEITLGRGVYFRERIAKASEGPTTENWWAGSTVAEQAVQKGLPLLHKDTHDPIWNELVNFFASIREGKPVAAPLEIGVADALAVIYANRAIDTGRKVFWPKKKV